MIIRMSTTWKLATAAARRNRNCNRGYIPGTCRSRTVRRTRPTVYHRASRRRRPRRSNPLSWAAR